MDSVFLVTSEYNDACGCHPEYCTAKVGAFLTREAAELFIKNAPQTTMVRNMSKTVTYEIDELYILG